MIDGYPVSATRPGGPDGSINAVLRSLRQAAGMSLDVLAARTNYSKPYLSNVESGRRRVTVEIAEAYDGAFGTGGLLVRLLTGVAEMPVGRTGELAEMHRLCGELGKGQGNVLWVEGEPGIGKSMLLRAGFAGTDPRVRTVWATADESLARFPLWVLLDQIRLDDTTPELAEITGLLRDNPVGVGSGDPVVAAAERLVMLIERWCVTSPVLLVLDDLQWADEMSLAVWGRLRRLVGQLPLLLAGSCRPVPRRPEVLALRRTITEPDGVLMSLAPLARAAVTELTGRLAGAPPGARLQAAADQAGGNPLYLRELVDALRRDNRIQLADRRAEIAGANEVPSSLKAAIGTRLTFLSEDASSVLRLAALLGPEPTIDELTAVTGRPASELTKVLDEAIAAGVLTTARNRMAFRHGLIRMALYDQIPRPLGLALHRQTARALAKAGTRVEAVAEHLLAGSGGGADTEDWVTDWLADGAAAELVNRAPAVAWELIDRIPEPGRTRLAGNRISVLSALGRDDDVIRSGPAVLADATDPQTIGLTAWALAYSLGRVGRRDDGRVIVRETLARDGLSRVWRARLHACDAVLAREPGVAAYAVARAEESGDAFALGYALNGQAMGYQYGSPDEKAALACIERALAVIGDRPETADLRVLLLSNRAVGLLNVGRIAEVPQALGVALAAAERSGSVLRLMVVRSGAVGIYYDCGRWDDALAELDALSDLPDLSADTIWQRRATAADIAVHRDDLETLAVHLAALPDDPSTDDLPQAAGRLRVARALALESAGRTEEAAEAILVAGLRPGTNPLAPALIYDCEWIAPDIVRLALAVGRRAEAEAFTQAITTRAHTGAAETVAIAHHCQGLLRADPDLVAAAVDGYALVLDRAQAQENLAVLLAGRGDLHAARAAYEAATETYARLEAAWDLRRAEARLRPLGLGRTPHHIRRRPATGWKALTPTELRVAELVAGGLSNPDVAARLEVSRRTVETHVAHILTKLGGRSRAEIALAHQRHHP